MDSKFTNQLLTACKKYCHPAAATQGNIAYTQTVTGDAKKRHHNKEQLQNINK
jgi:hypothetical protein